MSDSHLLALTLAFVFGYALGLLAEYGVDLILSLFKRSS